MGLNRPNGVKAFNYAELLIFLKLKVTDNKIPRGMFLQNHVWSTCKMYPVTCYFLKKAEN